MSQAFKQLFKNKRLFTTTALFASSGYVFYNKNQMQNNFNLAFMPQIPAEAEFDKIADSLTKQVKRNDHKQCKDDLTQLVRQKNCGPILIRLSWHDAGTFEAAGSSGGPRACMRFGGGESAHGANAGLQIARDLVAPIKAKYPSMSHSDLWSLAACIAVKEMGGPDIPWRAGRRDSTNAEQSVEDGRLPDATQGCPHLRSVFHRMGFSDQEIVCLSGAHAVGSCHADRSGFIGPWTSTPLQFGNGYFKNLVSMKWSQACQEDGKIVYKSDADPNIIMLPSDIALLTDEKMVPWVELYATDEERFFADFSVAFTKLQELGVPAFHSATPYNY